MGVVIEVSGQRGTLAPFSDPVVHDVLDALPNPIVVIDRNIRVAAMNDSWRRLAAAADTAPGNKGDDYLELAAAIFGSDGHLSLAMDLPGIFRGVRPDEAYTVATRAAPTRWFNVQVAPFGRYSDPLFAVNYQDVTDIRMLGDKCRELDLKVAEAEDAERRRIAQELHDSTGQYLTAAALDVARLHLRLSQGKETLDIVRALGDTLHEAQSELRAFSYVLHSPALEEVGLAASLDHLLKGFGERTGLLIGADIACALDSLPRPVQHMLYRIVQEALTNVHRHARARRASIRIRWALGRLLMDIEDDGIGIRQPKDIRPRSEGLGLTGMRARAAAFGGTLKIGGGTAGGTILSVAVPCPAA
jgi:signal transduction histidine kinase